jgi:formate hydrogenlyase subunit 6/NADH:ubiquinone oxidoreductase subunit I/intein/homing endonuclease
MYEGVKHIFKHTFTVKYPYQKVLLPKGFRGRHLLYMDKCTGCGICAWICPERCITLVPTTNNAEYPQNPEKRFPQYWYARCCFCHFCVTPETLVTANPSVKPIGEIEIGDLVLTHTGLHRKVRQVYRRNYSGRLYTIRPLGAPFSLNVTEDHPLLASTRNIAKKGRLEKQVREPSWKTPKELKPGDYLTLPIMKETRDTDFFEQQVTVGQPSTGRRLPRQLKLPASLDLFRLVGYYLAEGYVVRRTVGFAFGEHEKEYISDTIRLLKKLFKGEPKTQTIHHSTHVLLHSVVALQFFETFGRSSDTKRIPDWMMFAPVEKQKELVRGAWRGDGYFHEPTKGNRSTFFEYVTVSRALAFQLQQLLMRNRLVGELATTHHKNRKTSYILTVRGRFVPRMTKLMGIRFKDVREKTFTRFELDDSYLYAPIQRISSTQVTNQPVVNLSVEGDESYVAGNVTAHNCTDYCPTGALDYTPDYELAEYDRELLLWSPERLAKPPTNVGEYHSVFHGSAGDRGVTFEPVAKQKTDVHQD